jgi:hypothetical protein
MHPKAAARVLYQRDCTSQVSENTANVRAANTLAITNELNAFRKMRMASQKKARAG